MNKLHIGVIIGFGLLSACNSGPFEEVAITTLNYDMEADSFRDTIFFSQIKCLLENEGNIYFTDHKNVRMMRTDKDLDFLNIIGKSQGRGPKDLGFISHFSVARDTLWVGDSYKHAFVRFTTAGEFVDLVEPGRHRYVMNTRFAIDGQKVFLSNEEHDGDNSLAMFDMQTGDYRPFGYRPEDFGRPAKNYLMNFRHVFIDNDHIVSVPKSIPVVEVVDKGTMEPIASYDLLHYSVMRNKYDHMLNHPMVASSSGYILVEDAYLAGQYLYLLINIYGEKSHSDILVFNVRDEMKLVKQYSLDEGVTVLTICATNDYLYAFVLHRNSIRRYPLN